MKINKIVWLEPVVDKLASKHHVVPSEVEEVLKKSRHFFFVEEGDYQGEDVYVAMGQTRTGRYLAVFFIYKKNREALVLSARDMTHKEVRRYGKK